MSPASRLIGVNTAIYSYVANSPLVSQIEFKNSGTSVWNGSVEALEQAALRQRKATS